MSENPKPCPLCNGTNVNVYVLAVVGKPDVDRARCRDCEVDAPLTSWNAERK